jgi:hypothetical protein
MNAAYLTRARHLLTWRHWAWATGLGALLGILVPLQNLHLNFYFTLWKMLYDTPFYVAFAWVFLLAIAGVEASVGPERWPSLWRYFTGAVVASLVCVELAWSLSDHFRLAPKRVISGGSSNLTTTFSPQHRRTMAVFEVGFDGVVHGWLATFVYAGLRRSRRAARVLADAEIGRSEAQRTLVAARLLAAHAQVDPAFVMQRLETIERAYESDPSGADGQLDELIAFLRDAIPRLRSDWVPQPQG